MNRGTRNPVHALLGMASALVIAALAACGGESTPPAAPQVTVERGVLALTPAAGPAASDIERAPVADNGDTALGQAGESTTDAAGEGQTTPNPGPALPAGAEVRARGQLRMYGTAQPTSPTLAEYQAGDLFVIMEPPGDVVVYPVELSGVRWYRVRAADGLVGWVIADGIEPTDTIEDAPVTN